MSEETKPEVKPEAGKEDRTEREIRRSTRRAHRHEHGHRSFFWPIVLIGVGVIWLLNNLGIISEGNFSILFRLWPMFLILIGLDVLFGRGSRIVGGLIGLLTVGSVVALLIFGSELGLEDNSPAFIGFSFDTDDVEVKHMTFAEPVSGAESANVDLEFGIGEAEVTSTGDNLVEADLTYIGTIDYDVSGGSNRQFVLNHRNISAHFGGNVTKDLVWDIGLYDDVPMDLVLRLGAGPANLDLAELMLTDLRISGGVGQIVADLPGGEYDLNIEGGAGSFDGTIGNDAVLNGDVEMGIGPFTLKMGEGADVDLDVSGGAGSVDMAFGDDSTIKLNFEGGVGPVNFEVGNDSQGELVISGGAGSIEISVPDGVGVRFEVKNDGTGGLDLRSDLRQVESGDRAEEGIWETDGFEDAEFQIVIIVEDAGVGPIIIR